MSALDRFLLRPGKGVREIYMGVGGLLLILAIISFAGASFTFDPERRALLRPLGAALAALVSEVAPAAAELLLHSQALFLHTQQRASCC